MQLSGALLGWEVQAPISQQNLLTKSPPQLAASRWRQVPGQETFLLGTWVPQIHAGGDIHEGRCWPGAQISEQRALYDCGGIAMAPTCCGKARETARLAWKWVSAGHGAQISSLHQLLESHRLGYPRVWAPGPPERLGKPGLGGP